MIRLARVEDIRRICELGECYFRESRFQEDREFSRSAVQETARSVIIDPLKHLLVAEADGVVVGFALVVAGTNVWSSGLSANINLVYVLPEYRGKGLAEELIDGCCSWASEHKMEEIISGDYAMSPNRTENWLSTQGFSRVGYVSARKLNA